MDKVTDSTETKPTFPLFVEELLGHTINLMANFRFEVEGPYFAHKPPRDKIFDALTDAHGEIRKFHAEHLKEEALKIRLDLRVMCPDGSLVTVNKINRTTGAIAGIPGGYNFVYPYSQEVREKIVRRVDLAKELKDIDESLEKVKIRVSRHYSRIDVDDLPMISSALQRDYNTALEELAKLIDLEKVTKPQLKVVKE